MRGKWNFAQTLTRPTWLTISNPWFWILVVTREGEGSGPTVIFWHFTALFMPPCINVHPHIVGGNYWPCRKKNQKFFKTRWFTAFFVRREEKSKIFKMSFFKLKTLICWSIFNVLSCIFFANIPLFIEEKDSAIKKWGHRQCTAVLGCLFLVQNFLKVIMWKVKQIPATCVRIFKSI